MLYSTLEIQNALRVLSHVIKLGVIELHGNDLIEITKHTLDGQQHFSIARTQDIAVDLAQQQS